MQKILALIICSLIVSCSLFKEKKETYPYGAERSYSKDDYEKHLIQIARSFIENNKHKIKTTDSTIDPYLKNLVDKIYLNNENIFVKKINIKLSIIKTKEIIYFSLPGGYLFMSSELISKYLKSENIFNAIFVTEFIKSNLDLYKKNIIVPRKDYSISEMIKFTKLNIEDRIVLNNLTYEVLKRTGLDAGAKLLWIQLQNRNSVDFARNTEFNSELLREEFLMKNYMIATGEYNTERQQNSSKEFYRFRGRFE